ncbi:MAG: hypothetical protein C0432_03215 [Candidatus Puniceispirillum sp.]|nr:hypothetical protein [Candidatus Pelagibacter sp.]MBA4283284.1 hypothetical protein [Candidatus Puniceispirillum sp.]
MKFNDFNTNKNFIKDILNRKIKFIFTFIFFILSNLSLIQAENKACGKGGTDCSAVSSYASCIYQPVGKDPQYCLSGDCQNSPFSQCIIPPISLVPCGQGGILCTGGKVCALPDLSALCVEGPCSVDSKSQCVDSKTVACGLGGLSCPQSSDPIQQTYCIKNDKSALCQSDDCRLGGASCQLPSSLNCGKGGSKCESGSICSLTAQGPACLFGSCLSNPTNVCSPIDKIQCGKGGTFCPDNSYCSKYDSTSCKSGDCLTDVRSTCQPATKLLCGQGGVACPENTGTVCSRADESGFCPIGDACMKTLGIVGDTIGAACSSPTAIPCGKGGTKCDNPAESCILNDNSALCLTGECLQASGEKGASCKSPSVLPCGKGGTMCGKSKDGTDMMCVLADKTGLCTQGSCVLNGSSCELPNVLPCGKGGTACPQSDKLGDPFVCMVNDKSGLCTQGDCLKEGAVCEYKSKLPCGLGGTQCPVGDDINAPQRCILNDQSALCLSGSCLENSALDKTGSSCQSPLVLPCGLGGTFCPKNDDPLKQTLCVLNDKSSACTTGSCMNPDVQGKPISSCQLPSVLPCGKGGTMCSLPGTVCMWSDRSEICSSGDCINLPDISCQDKKLLPCGKGGLQCGKSENGENLSCLLNDQSALCTTESCMNSSDAGKSGSSCQLPKLLPCGKGGTTCPTSADPEKQTTCVKNDKSGLCLTGDCLAEGKAYCALPQVMPCGRGGTVCPVSTNASLQTVCILNDKTDYCTDGECMRSTDPQKGSSCQLASILPCGKGGSYCKDSKTKCILANKTKVCDSGSCLKDATNSCQISETSLPCGKGGLICATGQVCVLPDKSMCRSGQPCVDSNTLKCVPIAQADCGKGGTGCSEPGAVCVTSDIKNKCTSGSCLTDGKSLCKSPMLLPCGKGGTTCPTATDPSKQTQCILNNKTDFCKSGACLNSSSATTGSSCQLPDVLPCGKGGLACKSGTNCSTFENKICQSGELCMSDSKSKCQSPLNIVCGFGGIACPQGSGRVCALGNLTNLCAANDTCRLSAVNIMPGGSVAQCVLPSELPCGKGGSKCSVPNPSSTSPVMCLRNDFLVKCSSGTCMNSSAANATGSSCQAVQKLPCGKGGATCPKSSDPLKQTFCILNDKTKLCESGACMESTAAGNAGSSCQLKSVLPCGKGGSTCPKSSDPTKQTQCINMDKSALCTSDSCMDPDTAGKARSYCDLPSVLPCGKGGVRCANATDTCMAADKNTVCTSGTCMNDSTYTCQVKLMLPCGLGGARCDDTKTTCLLNNKTSKCSTGSCLGNPVVTGSTPSTNVPAQCLDPNLLPCGKGGLTCPTGQSCLLADLSNYCTGGDCVNPDVSGKVKAVCAKSTELPCGKGGSRCAESAVAGDKNVCANKGTPPSLCTVSTCMGTPSAPAENSTCMLSSLLPCGKGGIACSSGSVCAKSDLTVCPKNDRCTSISSSKCRPFNQVICGSGGTMCPANSGTLCALTDESAFCKPGEACMSDNKSSCADPAVIPCGKGGSLCPSGQSCLDENNTLCQMTSCPSNATSNASAAKCANPGACMSDSKSTCKPSLCGQGGTACPASSDDVTNKINKVCMLNDFSGLCTTPDCMFSTIYGKAGASCQSDVMLPCSQGGLACGFKSEVYLGSTTQNGSSGDGGLATSALLKNPASMVFDSNDTAYVVDVGNKNIRSVDSSGKVYTLPQPAAALLSANAVFTPQWIVVNSKNQVIVYDSDSRKVLAYDSGTRTWSNAFADSLSIFDNQSIVASMTIDLKDTLYIALKDKKTILGVTPATGNSASVQYGSSFNVAENIADPTAMAIDESNNLIVPERSQKKILKFSSSATTPTKYTSAVVAGSGSSAFDLDCVNATRSGMPGLKAVSISKNGHMYILDDSKKVIRLIPSKSQSITTISGNQSPSNRTACSTNVSNTAFAQSFQSPQFIANDRQGNIYVVDGSAVYKITPDKF